MISYSENLRTFQVQQSSYNSWTETWPSQYELLLEKRMQTSPILFSLFFCLYPNNKYEIETSELSTIN